MWINHFFCEQKRIIYTRIIRSRRIISRRSNKRDEQINIAYYLNDAIEIIEVNGHKYKIANTDDVKSIVEILSEINQYGLI